jgi:phosphate transport system substrate-binding protein
MLNRQIPNLRINYQSTGSGAGVEQFKAKTVDFAASDVAMTDAEMQTIPEGVLLLPMTAGSLGLAYNLPGIPDGLRLPRSVYTQIFLGEINHWQDPAIQQANPHLSLPNLPIIVIHRADGSGSTEVFTKHLSAISEAWKLTCGSGKNIAWPEKGQHIGAKGNEGVTVQLLQTPGSIGYVDYSYAVNTAVTMAALENQAGQFIFPSLKNAAITLESLPLPDNLRLFILDPPGFESYPLVTYTWLLVYQHYADPDKARAMELLIEYGLNQGQQIAPRLGYVPLPLSVRQKVAATADHISPDYSIVLQDSGLKT